MASLSLPQSPVYGNVDVVTVRKATMSDIHSLLNLINDYAANGIMLPLLSHNSPSLKPGLRRFQPV